MSVAATGAGTVDGGEVHAGPHETVPPQPSGTVPQLSPAGQVVAGVHPQTLGVPPPPQVCGAVHAGPQETVPPQPSEKLPHINPCWAQVRGTQPPTHLPVGSQTVPAGQVPQLIVPPHPSGSHSGSRTWE